MHDLSTINRLNEEAHAKKIQADRAAGRHVVATYEGMHLVSFRSFDDVGPALDHISAAEPNTGQRRIYFGPTNAAGRAA